MPQNGITPQNPDAEDDLDLFEEHDDQGGTQSLSDDEFDDLVDALADEWP
ncbi:hypothetical protein ABIA32_005436 [Streptacidiphilus sp. MAP12-20]